jgi:hypothetical protein
MAMTLVSATGGRGLGRRVVAVERFARDHLADLIAR